MTISVGDIVTSRHRKNATPWRVIAVEPNPYRTSGFVLQLESLTSSRRRADILDVKRVEP